MARERQKEVLDGIFGHLKRRAMRALEENPEIQRFLDSVVTEERAEIAQRLHALPFRERVIMAQRVALHIGVGNLDRMAFTELVKRELVLAEERARA